MTSFTKGAPYGGSMPKSRIVMEVQPPQTMRSTAFDWDYEINVALPASYGDVPDRAYPVLWLTDGIGFFHLAIGVQNCLTWGGLAPELIIVSVGSPNGAGMAEAGRRRGIDFAPPGDQYFYDGPGGDFLADMVRKAAPEMPLATGGAAAFLAFLVDEVRPALARQFRMADEHALFGHSGGGMFVNYALFARPGAFRGYIIGSPSSNAGDRAAFRMEAEHAAQHKDLAADVFFGAGETEIGELMLAAWGIVSAPVLMAETLLLRQYPSLRVTTRIFGGKNHLTVIPDVLAEGIQAVWGRDGQPATVPSQMG